MRGVNFHSKFEMNIPKISLEFPTAVPKNLEIPRNSNLIINRTSKKKLKTQVFNEIYLYA